MDAFAAATDYVPVNHFYNGKSVLVTGGTGFLGKVFIEKLLWSCPGIERIYVLMRSKKNKEASTRLAEALNTKVFERLRNSRPSDLKKIVLVAGNLEQPSLGMSHSNKNEILRTVSIVFHIGASVRFNDSLKQSVAANVKSTKYICELCHDILDLQALVYVSTAYSNCDRAEVEEVVYALPQDADKIIDLVDLFDEEIISKLTPKLIAGRPNVYTYTKALAENILQKESGTLPLVIVRPSIVLSTVKEPVEGWIDTWRGPTGLAAAAFQGLIHWILADPRLVGDFVPADMFANLTICAGWHKATKSDARHIDVYNFCSGLQNPLTWGEFLQKCDFFIRANPVEGITAYTFIGVQRDLIRYRLQTFLFETFPLVTLDWAAKIIGKTTNYVDIYFKAKRAHESCCYFCTHEWKFKDGNVIGLYNCLAPEDKHTFPFLLKDIDWNKYVEFYIRGIGRHLLKKDQNSVKSFRKRNNRFFSTHHVIKLIIYLTIVYIFFMSYQCIKI